jgi:hypothetical protein
MTTCVLFPSDLSSLTTKNRISDQPRFLGQIVMDMAKIIGRKLEGSDGIASQEEGSGSQLHHKLGRSVSQDTIMISSG